MNPSSAIFFLITIIIFFTQTVSTQTISYSHHCSSFAPEAIPTQEAFTRYPYLEPLTSHYTGGQRILGQDPSSHTTILLKATRNVFTTNITDTYKVEARLTFFPSDYSQLNRTDRPQLVFFLDGFCYITLKTSLVSGILESLASPYDSDYFEPISMMGFPQVAPFKYSYTLVSNEECNKGNNSNTQQDSATSMQTIDICSSFNTRTRTYRLQYPSSCSSTKNCTPFGQGSQFLPSFVALNGIQCSSADKKLRFLVEFRDRRCTPDGQSFDPNITLIGEGTWNGTKDELCIVACRILKRDDPMGAHVGDCSTRLTLWYPAVRSIKNTHTEGRIWTTKTADDVGYFETIKFLSFSHNLENYGSKYEFTQMKKVRRFCAIKKHAKRQGEIYPSEYGHHQDMNFQMSVKHKNKAFTGFAIILFVGNRVYNSGTSVDFNRWQTAQPSTAAKSTTSHNGPLNVRYEIEFILDTSSASGSGISSLKRSATIDGRVAISAEGFYDDQTGQLCMVGCRNLRTNSINASFDCEILVRFQLPPTNGDHGSFLEGSIESLRKETDVLYFEHLDVFSPTYIAPASRTSIWRMDLKIIMVLISDAFSCVFIARLLFHVKKRPETVPSISVLMMLILALGHMVRPVLNFEGVFSNTRIQNGISLGTTGGWLETMETVARTMTMVAFILQFHLLHLIWTTKPNNNDGNRKNPWVSEMQTLVICLPMYIVGGLTTLLVNSKNNDYTIWDDLRSYAGLTLDGFLLPQVVLNILQISKGNALSHSFYVGTTFVRLLPHAYDLYRGANNITHQFDRLYIYANPRTDFYSPSRDIVICCAGIAFVVIVFLQQRVGGRFMFPKRFRESGKLITHCL
ncbi:hypothetical protein L6452_28612 [Arctium lappa]|uniref:Uncharacterized protein n=1 Tax=Arctium lappa TaxID=4217 RepID=A0ACB8ZYS4_ARCLA|nr:hypothetical protein L6452_28612 [Arctium lappa]